MMKYRKLFYLMFVGAFLIIVSCNNQQKKGAEKDGFNYDDKKEISDIAVTKSFIYAFPSPGDLLDRIGDAGLTFQKELMNTPSSAESYLSSKNQALNLGIYVSDLAYSAMFSRSSEAVDYLEVVRSLSKEVHISNSAFESLIDRARDNIGDADSMIDISNEVFYQMVEYLENSGKENTIALVSAGAYIESMHIALETAEGQGEDSEIFKQIAELKYPMQNLLDHAETVSDDPNVKSILQYIRDLNKTFSELEQEAGVSEVKHDEPGVITLSGGGEDILDEEHFNALKTKVAEIRNYIVKI